MEQNFEEDIPFALIIGVFVVLMVGTHFLRKHLRQKNLIRQGQLSHEGGKVPTIEERIAGNKAWASGEIHSKGVLLVYGLWLVTVVWNLTFGVSFIKSLSNPEIAGGGRVILGIFAVLGLVPLGFAVRFTIQHFRFGVSTCKIVGKAGVLGKEMTGTIRTKNKIITTGDYIIVLECLEHYTVGSGKNRKTETRTHFQTKQTVPHAGKNSSLGVPFSFDIPTYPPETGDQITSGDVNWQLKISAPVEGVDYGALFIVPVFNID